MADRFGSRPSKRERALSLTDIHDEISFGETKRITLDAHDLDRIVIIGNSGSGKSTLAKRLSTLLGATPFDLDEIHWLPQGDGTKQDAAVATDIVARIAREDRWIIEGVYGWLAKAALPSATLLIWLDLPWSVCRAALKQRGLRRGARQADHEALLLWAAEYWVRCTSSSFAGHKSIYDDFPRGKARLTGRQQIAGLLDEIESIGGR